MTAYTRIDCRLLGLDMGDWSILSRAGRLANFAGLIGPFGAVE